MKRSIAIIMALVMCLSLCACGENKVADEMKTDLEPNLQRLQGSWAASENYDEDTPSFECAMPATWDADMKGYYVVTIKDNQLVYKNFHKKGNNGRPGGNYEGNVSEYVFEIEKVTEKESDDYQTLLLLELAYKGEKKEFQLILYDNPEIYKNSFMVNGFADFMFVKLDKDQYSSLMSVVAEIKYDNDMSKKLEPYIGMPKAQLENSTWGKPTDKNVTKIEGHIFEQWCYSGGRYVYVDDGYVSAIQE